MWMFFQGLGEFKMEHDIVTRSGAVPVVKPARRVPTSIQPKLEAHLKELEAKGVIEKVNVVDEETWVSNLVTVEKPNNELRVCLDPTEVNKEIVEQPCILHMRILLVRSATRNFTQFLI